MEMIPLVKTFLPPASELMPALESVLYSGYIAQGQVVEDFERAFERYIEEGYSLSLNSGTAALHIALILAGVQESDEVITTALTAEPTNVAIKMMGAKIRYADVDLETGAISPSAIENVINERTKAIIVVDYAGIPVDVMRIQAIAQRHNLTVIQDAAHALGAKYNGKKTGCHFPYTVFSLQAIKHITTVDGGVLQLLDEADYHQGKLVRWFGLDKMKTRLDNNIQYQGYKYHMNNVNAAIGLLQMEYVDSVVNKYIDNGKYFDANLKDTPGIELIKYYENSEPSYWLYTAKVENRDGFIRKMAETIGIVI
jgi:perosamine synthetase